MVTEDNQNTADTVNEWVCVNKNKIIILVFLKKGFGIRKTKCSQTHQT